MLFTDDNVEWGCCGMVVHNEASLHDFSDRDIHVLQMICYIMRWYSSIWRCHCSLAVATPDKYECWYLMKVGNCIYNYPPGRMLAPCNEYFHNTDTEMVLMDKWVFARFEFRKSSGELSYIVTPPRLRRPLYSHTDWPAPWFRTYNCDRLYRLMVIFIGSFVLTYIFSMLLDSTAFLLLHPW